MALPFVDVLRQHWPGYCRAHRTQLNTAHYRAVRAVLRCRTEALGGQLYQCEHCAKTHFAYHSCNHRSCPQCGALDQQAWCARQEAKLLPGIPYFMVTFTIPAKLRPACLAHPKHLYDLLLRESAAALRDIIATKTKGGQAGFISVLHTWGRQLQHHPHVHCIVPAVAWHPERDQLIHPKNDTFLVHFNPLARRFRNRLRQALQQHHPKIWNSLSGAARRSLSPAQPWNVQLKHVGKGNTALRYLAAYVHRSAFSPKRLLGYDRQGRVLLKWTCSQTGKRDILKLPPHEFLRRWLLHVLPKGLVRIRHFGWLSNAATKTRLRVRALLGCRQEPAPIVPEPRPFRCEHCGSNLVLVGELDRRGVLTLRGPPASRVPT